MTQQHENILAKELKQGPWETFRVWYKAMQIHNRNFHNAMTLSTANKCGKISSRTVLLKEWNQKNGFIFYTNYESVKGRAIKENPQAGLLFYCDILKKQIIISGTCQYLLRKRSEMYFHSRPRPSQIGAWASQQSRVMQKRQELEIAYKYYEKKFTSQTIPLPPYWGGIAVFPTEIEFWEDMNHRLHHRLKFFFRSDKTYYSEILYP